MRTEEISGFYHGQSFLEFAYRIDQGVIGLFKEDNGDMPLILGITARGKVFDYQDEDDRRILGEVLDRMDPSQDVDRALEEILKMHGCQIVHYGNLWQIRDRTAITNIDYGRSLN